MEEILCCRQGKPATYISNVREVFTLVSRSLVSLGSIMMNLKAHYTPVALLQNRQTLRLGSTR